MLPWLEETFQQMDSAREEAGQKREKLSQSVRQAHRNGGKGVEIEIGGAQEHIMELDKIIDQCLREVAIKGIIVRDPTRELVDFPAFRKHGEVFLCWMRGEPKIAYWHETNVGYAGRQPL